MATATLPRKGQGAHERAKTHCPQGHPYDEKNTRWYQGKRYCRICNRKGARRASKRAARPCFVMRRTRPAEQL
jgi:hypothetical protein